MNKLKEALLLLFTIFSFEGVFAQGQSKGVETLDKLLELKWTAKGQRYSSNPLVNEGLIFETYGLAYAYEAASGKKLYFSKPEDQEAIKEITNDSLIFFSSRGGQALVNIFNGKTLYKSNNRIREPWIRKPRVINGPVLFSATDDSTFSAISVLNGKKLWERHIENIYNIPIKVGDAVYVSGDKFLYKIEASSGEILEKILLGKFASDPKLNGELLYVWIKGMGLACFDLSLNSIVWKNENSSASDMEILLNDSILYTTNASLSAHQSINGTVAWRNDGYTPADAFMMAETQNYLLTYRRIDDYACLTAARKSDGKISFECFSNIFDSLQNPKPERPLIEMDGLLFRFGNEMHENLIFATDQNGTLYCFQVNEQLSE
ncbi:MULTISPECIES: PQQ-binding-like beta-propeller repeat protein [unclassified Imperialibacter]|uniref:outer membrane protein assembly factor BamB family protein n=1 Tax=unclassified Imperialibacter TaxID=2629706 RepID=UPI0012517619|nr:MULTISPECIES: PQQ-binding-like beta-propeller repeat protein [unclassified Imperialibacter]CAD5257227.1 hypothetical protein IMPERIA89_240073 [Imperialibacter sp. 89]CAD5272230.1 hypothetical protein IMPERIA75_390073 [Imperialibacter sp. 75]VVT32058.1 hypothetical protein IMPR6_60010 [Imperialibacter sp. EC-SDR9]